jgi:hypothetical protein
VCAHRAQISLEPLKALRFPPFELGTDESHATYFDGRILANYLVSTGSFLHPISRRELTRDDCERLDRYLSTHKLGDAGVLIAYNRREEYKNGVHPEEELAQLQEAAAALLHNLYLGATRPEPDRGARGGRGGGRDGGGRGGGRGGGAPDDEDAGAEAAEPFDDTESVALGGASLGSVDDFPTLSGAPGAPTAAPLAPLSSSWIGSTGAAGRRPCAPPATPHTAAARPEEFPALGGMGGARGALPQPAPPRGGAGLWSGSISSTARAPPADGSDAPMSAALAPPPSHFPGLPDEAFPSLGGGGARRAPPPPRPALAPAVGGWSRAATAPPPPSVTAAPMQSVAALAAPPPPRKFEEQPEDFPSLGTVAVQKATAASVPTNRDECATRPHQNHCRVPRRPCEALCGTLAPLPMPTCTDPAPTLRRHRADPAAERRVPMARVHARTIVAHELRPCGIVLGAG